jgi:hypothetical protein
LPPHRSEDKEAIEHGTIWPLPFNMVLRRAKVEPGKAGGPEELHVMQMTWNDLLMPILLPTIPVHIRASHHTYQRGKSKPVQSFRLYWNPFCAGLRHDSVGRERTSRLGGFPLVYTKFVIPFSFSEPQGENTDASGFLSLLTLGPAHVRINQVVEGDGPTTTTLFKATVPLLLGGVLGPTLWTSYRAGGPPDLKEADPDNAVEVSGHGPFFGLGGVTAWRKALKPLQAGESVTRRGSAQRTRFVLFGILWSDYVRRDPTTGKLLQSRYGPLWSMFGWGNEKGWFRLRFLGISMG